MQPDWLADVDILLVDIQDVGSRYYTFATSVSYIFDSLATHDRAPHVVVIERPNPAGAQVEGTILTAEYQSFVGRPGLPHRHGLTLGELCRLYKQQAGAYKLELSIIHAPEYERQPELLFPDLLETGTRFNVRQCWEIAPSPNMPTPFTPLVYSGQCLLEGTNLSEGRGTTRPFEIWGAPYLRQSAAHFSPGNIPVKMSGARLRPLRFLPMFQKHAGQICFGFQIHLTGEPYHSLAHTLKLLRWLRESHTDFAWLEGVYEFVSDRPAIEILAGDPVLLAYLDGRESFRVVREKLEQAEHDWIQAARELRVYHRNMSRVALDPAEDFG
ncbi:MAG: DUF1343 domain-containing protein, partial [Leptospiraceae bacterium]|nr:DUF1343 domain-containing protein [Leptospiraceae bacterium]